MAKKKKERPRRRGGSSVTVVILLELLLGIVVGVGCFGYAYKYMAQDTSDEIDENRFSANEVLEQAQQNLMGSDIDAVVRSKDETSGTLELMNLKNDTTTTVTASNTTIFPRGENINTLEVGDIITYVFDKEMKLVEVKPCEKEEIIEDTGVAINLTSKLVKFTDRSSTNSDRSIKYVDGFTTVHYKDQEASLANISPYDYVAVHCYNSGKISKCYNIRILKSHGEIIFQNTNAINDFNVFIDGQVCDLKGSTKLMVTEGAYNVRVTGTNTRDIVKDVNVVPGSPAIIDLSLVVIKQGVVTLSANVTDYKVYINDKEYNYGDSILLPYGTYKLKATKTDYKDLYATINVMANENPVQLKFEKLQEIGTVTIKAVPETASIYLNDTLIGTGESTQTLALGSYVAKCSAPGYSTQAKQINLSVDKQHIDVVFDLTGGEAQSEEQTKAE